MEWRSISDLLAINARRFAMRPALLSESACLTHAELYSRVRAGMRALASAGVRRGATVVSVLPSGPDAALAFLIAACNGRAVPLNPVLGRQELEFAMRDSAAAAVLLNAGHANVRELAAQLALPVIEMDEAVPNPPVAEEPLIDSDPEAIALVLHTSGTTAQPKRVPLSHRNLLESARNIGAVLELSADDVSLSIMPLFHIHGLACLLAALAAGGSCACAGAFEPQRLAEWLAMWQPTWLSAAPTMLQAAADLPGSLAQSSLRLIRSSSAALPPRLIEILEDRFNVPVIEAYGMTEAAHQVASNRLPPHSRKRGSVGFAAGPRVTILDSHGTVLTTGQTGEIAIKGANVMRGYEENAAANAAAFTDGWFRTGDQGYLDADGYLYINGRLKELINRGGEKIAPREIDEALLLYPDVHQAVAFGVPHASLGEDLAAAVVLRAGASCDELKLRAFMLERLAAFKVPSRIVILDAIPVGATGKVQRHRLAAQLTQALHIAHEAAASELESQIARGFAEVLSQTRVGRHDNFFNLGGDSLRGVRLMGRLEQELSLPLPVSLVFEHPTPAQLAAALEALLGTMEIDQLARALSNLGPDEQAALLREAELAT